MTLLQLSHILLWVLAILLIPVSGVLLYLLVNLKAQVDREADSGIKGHWLVGRRISSLSCNVVATGEQKLLSEVLGKWNIVLGLSPNCGTCHRMLDELSSMPKDVSEKLTIVALCMGEFRLCKSMVRSETNAASILAYTNFEDADLFWIGWPAVLLVNEAGVVVDVRHPASVRRFLQGLELSVFEVPTMEVPMPTSRIRRIA